MKKALFILMTVMAPLFLLAQPMDTLTIYFENFDGDSVTLNSPGTPQHGAPIGDWRVVGTGITYPDWTPTYELYKSSPNSYRTPVYAASGNSQATTAPIPLTTTSFPVNKIYFNFDHICKIHMVVDIQEEVVLMGKGEGNKSDGTSDLSAPDRYIPPESLIDPDGDLGKVEGILGSTNDYELLTAVSYNNTALTYC